MIRADCFLALPSRRLQSGVELSYVAAICRPTSAESSVHACSGTISSRREHAGWKPSLAKTCQGRSSQISEVSLRERAGWENTTLTGRMLRSWKYLEHAPDQVETGRGGPLCQNAHLDPHKNNVFPCSRSCVVRVVRGSFCFVTADCCFAFFFGFWGRPISGPQRG